MSRRPSTADPDEVWPDRKERFKERKPPLSGERSAPKRPSIAQRDGRIEPFRAADGYINVFGLNPFDKEPAADD